MPAVAKSPVQRYAARHRGNRCAEPRDWVIGERFGRGKSSLKAPQARLDGGSIACRRRRKRRCDLPWPSGGMRSSRLASRGSSRPRPSQRRPTSRKRSTGQAFAVPRDHWRSGLWPTCLCPALWTCSWLDDGARRPSRAFADRECDARSNFEQRYRGSARKARLFSERRNPRMRRIIPATQFRAALCAATARAARGLSCR